MDLEVTRWKMADDLNPEEKAFLIEHKDELNDEEKDAFRSFLPVETPEVTEETPVVTETPVVEEPVVTPPVVEPPTPIKTFNTQEELDAFIAEQKAASAKPVDDKYFEEGKTFTDANEFARELEAAQAAKRKQEEERAAAERLKFEKEYEGLIVSHNLPKVDTEEGKAVKQQILKVGIEHGKPNFTEAYNLWSKIPQEFGGGFAPKTETIKKQEIKIQKDAASMVSKGGGGEGGSKPNPTNYSQLHNTDIDSLLDKALS